MIYEWHQFLDQSLLYGNHLKTIEKVRTKFSKQSDCAATVVYQIIFFQTDLNIANIHEFMIIYDASI